jgi:hypothetical protein
MLGIGGLVSTGMQAELTPRGVLGSRLKRWYFENYTPGTWTDNIYGDQIIENVNGSGNITPGNRTAIEMNLLMNAGGGNFNTGLPTVYGTGTYIFFCCLKCYGTTNDGQVILRTSNDTFALNADLSGVDQFWSFGAKSNSALSDNVWHTVIAYCHTTSTAGGTVKLYVDGVLQTLTASGAFGKDWTRAFTNWEWGTHSGTQGFNGSISSVGFAYTPFDFSATEIQNLHLSLLNIISPMAFPPGDPSSLSLTLWAKGSYAGAGTWASNSSAGTSGGQSLTEGTTFPDAGSFRNGYNPALFVAANSDKLSYSLTADNTISTSAYTISMLIKPVSSASTPSIIGDSGGVFGVSFTTSGITLFHTDGGGTKNSTTTLGTGAWASVDCRFDGAQISTRVNGGAWTNTAAGTLNSITGNALKVGVNSAGTAFYDGNIMELIVSNTSLSDTQLNNIRAYYNYHYGLSV